MKKIWHIIEDQLNQINIKKKLMIFYLCCVLLPLILTDSIVLMILLHGEEVEENYEMQNIASAVQSDLENTFDEVAKMTNTIYINRSMNTFLDEKYASGTEFFLASRKIEEKHFYEISADTSSVNVVMCSDNETIVNGNHFYRLSSVKQEEWYQKLLDSGQDMVLHFYYVGDSQPGATSKKKVSLVRRLNYYKNLECEKLVRIDIDYSTLVRKLVNMNYSKPVYVCMDDRILFSNVGYSGIREDFYELTEMDNIGYEREFEVYGEKLKILILEQQSNIATLIWDYFPLILMLLAINILLPWALTTAVNRSFVIRLQELSEAFDSIETEDLKIIQNIGGKDEIAGLMHNYNHMVRRNRELIKTVYKDRLEKQKIDIARQNAELLALHSQIDPHFLFNVLESIRMHSIIKGEEETASMIERLAILERRNVNWDSDYINLKEEVCFVEAYLELQKYRFGKRLSYKIDLEEACMDYVLPKLTLATFVENACIHGVEKKAVPCWIYIRIYESDGWLCLEIEDTGAGMEEETLEALKEKMQISNIETLMGNEHVGMVNAWLRLKMVTEGNAEFEMESEQGVGTFMLIKVPVNRLHRE